MHVGTENLCDAQNSLQEFVASNQLSIYSHPKFLEFLIFVTHGEARIIIAKHNDKVVGALPFMELKHNGFGRVVNSLPWYGSHGGCVLDYTQSDASGVRREILAHFCKAIGGEDLISSTVILSHEENPYREDYVRALSPTASDDRIGQITTLPDCSGGVEPELMNVLSQKTRNLVRKSLKQGFVERISDDDEAWNVLYRIHKKNMEAMDAASKPREHFDAIRKIFPPTMRRLSVALDGTTPVAALLLLYCGSTVEYITPVVDIDARPRQPLSFLIWHAMLDAARRGMQNWNWGGTWQNQRSLHHFKAGFGAQDRPYSFLITASPNGLEKLRANRQDLGAMFPFFYTYPYEGLDDSA
jgi:Acetyltransferase (GNAT) domain